MDRKITMLGTGHALVTKCYNTCFTITNGGNIFLVDAGGGNGILSQAEKAGIDFADIHQMFLTHAHTDHIIGVVWVVRKVVTMIEENKYHGSLDIYCHNEAASALTTICGALLAKKQLAHIGKDIFIRTVADGDTLSTGGMTLTFFDIKSTKLKQYGFRAVWDNGLALVCPGDEPLCEENYRYAQGADWLMHEAFCLASQADVFRPYEKHHSAALDAGKAATRLGVKNLILYHTEDANLANRKRLYTAEAKEAFGGNIFVPNDLEVINI